MLNSLLLQGIPAFWAPLLSFRFLDCFLGVSGLWAGTILAILAGSIFTIFFFSTAHCKEPIPKIGNKYSQKRNCAVPISTFMCLWAIYTVYSHNRSAYFAAGNMLADPVHRSQTRNSGNWDWGRAIPRKGIHTWDFRCSAASNSQLSYGL